MTASWPMMTFEISFFSAARFSTRFWMAVTSDMFDAVVSLMIFAGVPA
jgi:hypothetical protein